MFRTSLLTAALLAGMAQAGQWHALVVGANTYEDGRFDTLDGAVNDAQSLVAALKKQGVQPQVLLNDKVRYAAIRDWWQASIKQAKAGDTLFFSFAGHGAREAEHFPGTELTNARADGAEAIDDGLDEVLLLPGYLDQGKASAERIVDQEILGWAQQATQKGARVFIVADACFAGGMTRSALSGRDYGDTLMKSRNGGANIIEPEDRTPRGTEASAKLRASDKAAFGHRLVYAVPFENEEKVVPEIVVDGKTHGALSYLMAQALAGQARNELGAPVQTLAQLRRFLREQSRKATESGQQVSLEGIDQENKNTPFLPQAANAAPAEKPAAATKRKAPALFAGKDCPKLTAAAGLFTLASAPQAADFRWQCDDGTIVRTGVVTVAYDIGDSAAVQAFFRQQALLRNIEAVRLPRFAANIRAVQARPGQEVTVFEEGDEVAIAFAAPKGFDTLIALNLPAGGGVQMINAAHIDALARLPQAQGEDAVDTLLGETTVAPPFGNDHLLLLAVHRDTLAQLPFLSAVVENGNLPQGSGSDELLLDLQALSGKQAALAIVPFTSVRTTGGH